MQSPNTGKEMTPRREERTFTFRKETFPIVYHFFYCEDTGEQFVDTELGDLNLQQVHNQYRAKHNLPFPDEIRSIREKYGLPATKMSEILGFGVNSYGNYERGEVPSLSNAKIIQLAAHPRQFKELVLLADSLNDRQRQQMLTKLDRIISAEKAGRLDEAFLHYLLPSGLPDIYSGFRQPDLDKIIQMVVFFAQNCAPWKTQLNKLLFYADFLMFKRSCFSISGLRYRAIQNGPVPHNYDSLFEYLVNKEWLAITKVEFSETSFGEKFSPGKGIEPRQDLFSPEEWTTLHEVADRFGSHSARSISERSHREKGWIENHETRNLISYKYAFDLRES